MIKQHGVQPEMKKRNMAYKDILKYRIEELERRIASSLGEKSELEKELIRLRLAEFEEDIVAEDNQQLLKGQ